MPDPDNVHGGRGIYTVINGNVVNWNRNGGTTYQATVALTSNGFTYTPSNAVESTSGPNHTFVAVQFK